MRLAGPVNMLIDAVLIVAALFLAVFLRFDGVIPEKFVRNFLLVAPWVSIASVAALWMAGVHRALWRYVSVHVLVDIVKALTATSLILGIVNLFLPSQLFPRSVPFVFWMVQILLVAGLRVAGRLSPFSPWRRRDLGSDERGQRPRVLVFGAGDVGETLVRDLMRGARFNWDPVGFVDDDPGKKGRTIHALPVLGATLDIPKLVESHRIDEVIIAAPSAPSALVASIFRCCQELGIGCKTVPALSNYVKGKSPLQQLREVRIEDLLGREPVEIDSEEVSGFLTGRKVLVTGAGGSIGSELVRQIARFDPELLVALDHDENKLCYLGLEIRGEHADLNLVVEVGDVKDRLGIQRSMQKHKPDVIFHAAAHKHVNFMEENPRAAVLNNVLGTRIVVEEAIGAGVKSFVLISTDKAVNPTNVMGASKRLCEKIVSAYAQECESTRFSAVRFGNVLGSAGSVIPIFTRQIANGGPLTITHPEARRYFMTIPEASQLVIQAGAFEKTGTVYVLDMGEQVKVLDVARQLIRLSGYIPEKDIAIRFTGLRPGEKLYEELFADSERTSRSVHRKIFIRETELEDWNSLRLQIDALMEETEQPDVDVIKYALGRIVPEFRVNAPVVSLSETPENSPAPTRDIDERLELPVDFRPKVDAPVTAGMRHIGRYALALPAMALVGLLGLVHLVAAPGAPVFIREDRVGKNRRRGPRRMFKGQEQPIDRRSRDRRKRNMYGRPFARIRFNTTPRPSAGAFERNFYSFLRRRALDHLPSIVHVLTGSMSTVGPHPETVAVIERQVELDKGYRSRFTVKPGITGLAQVLGATHDDDDPKNRIEIDKFYIANRSMALDLRILTRTFAVVMAGDREEPLRLRDRLGVSSAVSTRLD